MATNRPTERMLSRILPMLIFIFGTWYFCMRIIGVDLEYIPGDLGDSRFINFLLEHGYQWMIGNQEHFWSASFMFPQQNTIAISDNMLGTMPIYGFFRVFGLSMETSYQMWWICICALNYWVTYFVLKKWFNRWDLAILGAWIFAFTIFNMGQLNYMQMTIRFLIPIVIYSAAKLVETSSPRYLFIFLFGIVYQFYCVIYTGFFLAYFSFGFIILHALLSKRYLFFLDLFKGKQLKYTLSAIVMSITLILILMLPYLKVSNEFGLRLFDEVKLNLPVWKAYFFPHQSSYLWSFMHTAFKPEVQNWWLQSVFAGLIPLIALLSIPLMLIYWKWKKIKISTLTWALSITILIIALLFIRTANGLTLYALIFKLPGMNSMRVLNRFMHVELFFIIAFILLLLKKISIKWSLLGLLLVFLDNSFTPSLVPREKKSEIQARRTDLKNEIIGTMDKNYVAFAVIDSESEPYETHIDAMLVSLELNSQTINGYSSSCPDDFGEFFNHNTRSGLNHWLDKNNISLDSVLILEK